MLKLISLITAFLFFCQSLVALELSLDVYAFQNVETNKSYIDAYIRILGNTVTFQPKNDGQQATVNITITIEQGEQIIAFDKYQLNSPLTNKVQDFLDLKRFGLLAGTYAVHIIASDANEETNKIELKKFVTVNDPNELPIVSDIQLLAEASAGDPSQHMVKHGLYMEPLTYSYVSDDVQDLVFFTELYGMNIPGYIKYSIYEGYTENENKSVLSRYKKVEVSDITPLILSLPLDKIRSGSYHLRVELFNNEKELLSSSKSDFIRSNKAFDKEYWENYNDVVEQSFIDSIADDDLRYNILSLLPVAKEPHLSLLETILDLDNKNAQRRFLLDYWTTQSPKFPGSAHKQYMKVVDVVDDLYDNNVGYGFQTDRGHLFLKYGKPNNVLSIDNEPDAFPYEIWYYNTLNVTRQTNVRFLFYNPSLAHNDYQLLHATCVGERNNPAWEVELYKRAPEAQIGASIEATEIEQGWNRRAKEYFNDY